MMTRLALAPLAAVVFVAGCATVPTDYPRTESTAFQPHESTTIGKDLAALGAEHQPLSLHMLLGAHHLTPLIGLACLALLPPILRRVRRSGRGG